MAGTYWLTILAETSKLEAGIRSGVDRASRGAVISPKYSTAGAAKAGQDAGREIQSGVESETRGGLGRLFRTDGSRRVGEQAGSEINAGLDSADVGRGLSASVSQNMGDGQSVGRRFGSALATGLKGAAIVGGGVAAAGIAGALKAGFGRLTAIDDATFKLRGLGNTAEQAAGIVGDARQAVLGTAFGLDEAATTAATAIAAGIKPGIELTNYLKLTADTAAIAGGSLSEMGYIFNKVQTSGKAFTNDLNMLADRGLPIFTWLQEEYQVSGEELSKMVADGKVDAETFRKVVAENIGGAAATMGESLTGSLKNLRSSYGRFGAELAGPIFAALQPLAVGFTAIFDDLTTAIKPIMADLTAVIGPWAKDMSARMTEWAKGGGIQNVMAFFSGLADRVKDLTSGGGSETMSSLSEGAKGLGSALSSAAPALQSVGTAMGAFGQAMIDVGPEVLRDILVPAMSMMAGGLRFLADNASWAVPALVALGGTFLILRTATSALSPIMTAWSASVQLFRTPLIIAQTAAIRSQAAAMTQLSLALGTNTVQQNLNTTATNAGAASTVRGRIAALGHAIATKAQAVATKAAAMGQWLLNAALTANPIGLVIAAIVAIGVALFAFFTKTEVGRKIWDAAMTAIKAVAGTVFEFLQKALQFVGDKISWLWQNIAQPAFEGIGTAISTMWNGAKVIWDAFTVILGKVGDKVVSFKDTLVKAFNAVKDVVSAVWDKIGGVLDKIGDGIQRIRDAGGAVLNAIGLGGNAAGGVANGPGLKSGGRINGPGSGTSDSILGYPAMVRVSNGEYVVNAASTRKFLPLLHALNSGLLPGLASGGLTPHATEMKRTIAEMFGVSNIGGYRERDGYNEHSTGNALDVMIPNSGTDEGKSLGDSITAWALKNAKAIGLTGAIWRQTSYGYGGGFSGNGKGMPDRGDPTANHFDHVHLFMNDKPDTALSLSGATSMSSVGASTSASGGSYRPATSSELSASSNRVSSAGKAVTQAQQRVDDRTFTRDQAQKRLDEALTAGKDTTAAEEAVRRANRELADANDNLAEKRQKAADVESADTELRTNGKLDTSSSAADAESAKSGPGGMDGGSLGQTIFGGLLESIGLDGSLFSNPLEWPSVKSLMAGVNFAGGLLANATGAGGSTPGGFASGAADAVGLGGMLSAIPNASSVLDMQSGSPQLAPGEFNPGVTGAVASAAGSSMSAFAPHGGGAGAAPGPAVDNSININGPVGMDPAALQTTMRTEQNARTRTTKVNG